MALGTINFFLNVAFVSEARVVGDVVNLDPRDRFSAVVIIGELLNPRALGLHHFVAIHADVHRRDGGVLRFVDPHVTIRTGDLQLTGMPLMIKRNGLLRGIATIVTQVPPGGEKRATNRESSNTGNHSGGDQKSFFGNASEQGLSP